MKDDELRRRIEEVRRAKERAGETRHDPETIAAVLRQVAVDDAANAAPPGRASYDPIDAAG